MDAENPREALKAMARDGYCLWVGAGLTMHLARAAKEVCPGWAGVVAAMERAAGVVADPTANSFQARLGRCHDQLGWQAFQRQLREVVFLPTCRGVLRLTVDTAKQGTWIPSVVRQIARLGTLANPIVSFNIETFTSRLLAGGDGYTRLAAFSPCVPGAVQPVSVSRHFTGLWNRFQRAVYHPHGAIDLSGICVMTDREYGAMNGTLAMQLAVHAAFGTHLVIVGMSLEDDYLRDQLAGFRPYLQQVLWFVTPDLRRELRQWAGASRITCVTCDWGEFWRAVDDGLPTPRDELSLDHAWNGAFNAAEHALDGGMRSAIEQHHEMLLADAPLSPPVHRLIAYLRAHDEAAGVAHDDATLGIPAGRLLDWESERKPVITTFMQALEVHGAFAKTAVPASPTEAEQQAPLVPASVATQRSTSDEE